MPDKPKKKGFDRLGYGALALYVSALAVVGLGVYGINVSTDMMDQTRSERARQQAKTGSMLIGTADRTQCRSIRFNNETAEISRETLIDCDPRLVTSSGGSSFNAVRDGFMKR